jgi:hypothetical protein
MTFGHLFRCCALLLALAGAVCLGQTSPSRFKDWWKIEDDNWKSIAESVGLSPTDRDRLVDAVALQLRPSMRDMGIASEGGLRKAAAQTWVKAVDLDGKGNRDFLALGTGHFLCSPTGNCAAWIFHKQRDKYEVILDRGAVQAFSILPSISNGFHDIVLHQHGSATSQGVRLFRFNGSAYRLAACYEADWQVLTKGGEVRKLTEPRMTPCGKTVSGRAQLDSSPRS